MTTPEHGYVAYTRGCRCDVCREAKRTYVADRRRAGLEPMRAGRVAPPAWNDRAAGGRSRLGLSRFRRADISAHNQTGYRRGCRCWDCTDDEVASRRRRHERRATA